MKDTEVCIKPKSPIAWLAFIGQGTEHTTIKWPSYLRSYIFKINIYGTIGQAKIAENFVLFFLILISIQEISNFLTEVECDHLISYAKRLGLEKSPLAKANETIDDETSERTFKIWDNNDDGFIEPVEVCRFIVLL